MSFSIKTGENKNPGSCIGAKSRPKELVLRRAMTAGISINQLFECDVVSVERAPALCSHSKSLRGCRSVSSGDKLLALPSECCSNGAGTPTLAEPLNVFTASADWLWWCKDSEVVYRLQEDVRETEIDCKQMPLAACCYSWFHLASSFSTRLRCKTDGSTLKSLWWTTLIEKHLRLIFTYDQLILLLYVALDMLIMTLICASLAISHEILFTVFREAQLTFCKSVSWFQKQSSQWITVLQATTTKTEQWLTQIIKSSTSGQHQGWVKPTVLDRVIEEFCTTWALTPSISFCFKFHLLTLESPWGASPM